MADGLVLKLGVPVNCADGRFGQLADLVIDPTRRSVTHLVVQPDDGARRLVPQELAAAGGGGGISLSCSTDEARKLPSVQEFEYLRMGETHADDPEWDVGIEDVLAMPYYSSSDLAMDPAFVDDSMARTYDRVPKGEVEIRRTSAVYSTDGHHLGHVDGFVVDGEDITHFVLERGHMWGKRDVTIPIGAVGEVANDTVTLSLTKDEVGELPVAGLHRWHNQKGLG